MYETKTAKVQWVNPHDGIERVVTHSRRNWRKGKHLFYTLAMERIYQSSLTKLIERKESPESIALSIKVQLEMLGRN